MEWLSEMAHWLVAVFSDQGRWVPLLVGIVVLSVVLKGVMRLVSLVVPAVALLAVAYVVLGA